MGNSWHTAALAVAMARVPQEAQTLSQAVIPALKREWSGGDSNAQLPACKAGTLPVELPPQAGFALHFRWNLHYNAPTVWNESVRRGGVMAKRRKRVPQLSYTENRGIGWHVSYRDPKSGTPRKHRFGMVSQEEAQVLYHEWVSSHLRGELPTPASSQSRSPAASSQAAGGVHGSEHEAADGSLIVVASDLLQSMEARCRQPGEPRHRRTIDQQVFVDRRRHLREFLSFINETHGSGAVARLRVADLSMSDVEDYNRTVVDRGLSASQVAKRLQLVKTLVNRAGRPEHGQQVIPWNWDSKDTLHGKKTKPRRLPTLSQLQRLLDESDLREQAMIWLAIGLGLGQRDLSVVRVGQIDAESYDLRRAKTGIERYGSTPPLVWSIHERYLKASGRNKGELLFLTKNGLPLLHGDTDSVQQWWYKLRKRVGESRETMDGFYTLRHLGATEFGSRPGCSISEMRRWLGHGASSSMADVYMRPVAPEHREVIEWIRESLASTDAST